VELTIRKAGNINILDLSGPLRIGEAEQKFREEVKTLMDGGEKHLAVNLASVPMVDSTGISAFVKTHRSLKEVGGKFSLFAPTKTVRQTLKMVGLDKFLVIYDDEASALAP
jgi:anti-anti-sigma factor